MTSFQVPTAPIDDEYEEHVGYLRTPEYVMVFEIPGPTQNAVPFGWLWCTVEPGQPGFTKKVATARDGVTPLDHPTTGPITGRLLFQY